MVERYAPSYLSEHDDLAQYIGVELRRIANTLDQLATGHIDPSYSAPDRPKDGDIRYADGTSWNPGSGEGFYGYANSAWAFLGG